MIEDVEHADIRIAVRKLCQRFPGEYWRRLDREAAYPSEFVAALTKSGFLATLIPEEYGGSGLTLSAGAAVLEEIQRAGCNGGACHAQMYIMGTLLRHGSEAQKRRYLPEIAAGRSASYVRGFPASTGAGSTAREPIRRNSWRRSRNRAFSPP